MEMEVKPEKIKRGSSERRQYDIWAVLDGYAGVWMIAESVGLWL
jgi:hypothetical protein